MSTLTDVVAAVVREALGASRNRVSVPALAT